MKETSSTPGRCPSMLLQAPGEPYGAVSRNASRPPRTLWILAEEIIAEASAAVKALEAIQKVEVVEFAEAMGEGRGTATARNALANRHKRELRRLQEEILGEALRHLASFYRDVAALRRGGREAVTNLDLLDGLESWSRSEVSETALMGAVEACLSARAALPQNANPLLTLEATLVTIARIAPAPITQPSR